MSYISVSQLGFGDIPTLDAFGRLRVSESSIEFDSQQEYGLNTNILWDATANGTLVAPSSNGSVSSAGNAVGPRDINTRFTPVTVSNTNGHYAILQSRPYARYVPGKSHQVFISGLFAAGSGYAASFVRRTATSGAPVDEVVPQANWNVDRFDGTGPSGITLDLTKAQVMYITSQWLGEGRVICGFFIEGRQYRAHQFLTANVGLLPYTQTYNLPVRLEMRNTGPSECVARTGYFDVNNGIFLQTARTVLGGSIQLGCASVQTEGGTETRGLPRTASNGITPVSVTTRRPVLSIRPKTTFNGLTNRGHTHIVDAILRARTNDAFFEVVFGGTLTGAVFNSVAVSSICEFDVAATAITGGLPLSSGFVASGAGAVAGTVSTAFDNRAALTLRQIDALAATQEPISIVCTSFTGTSDITAVLNWYEQTF